MIRQGDCRATGLTPANRALEVGKAAEHLVCADLILAGHKAFLADQGMPYDVVADVSGRLVRIQVKSTAGHRNVPQRSLAETPVYQFHIRRAGKGGKRVIKVGEFDLLALVALDVRVIAYMALSVKVLQSIHLRPPGVISRHANASRGSIDRYPLCDALASIGIDI